MFERGFKTWCENVSLQQRKRLSLNAVDPLDPWKLAQSLEIVVWRADEVPGIAPDALDVLTREDPDCWSAVTLKVSRRTLVILNPTHSRARSASDLMHELAHILLGHQAARVDVTEDNLLMLHNYSRQQEDEANWLAGCLLLPRPALLHIKRTMDHATAKNAYGVSQDMLNFRMRVSGVERQLRSRYSVG